MAYTHFTNLAYTGAFAYGAKGSEVDLPNFDTEAVTAANTLTAAESGRTYFLNAAGGFASTLPAPAAGLRYKFVVKTAPTTAYTVVTNGSANVIFGAVSMPTGGTVAASEEDTISFVANTSLPGDWAEVVSDGTNWYVSAVSSANGGITITQAS